MARSAQRPSLKKIPQEAIEAKESTAEIVILQPIGYPLCGIIEEYPRIEEPELFECYARMQWNGYIARKNDYLFDHRMFPDFAYRIQEVRPEATIIGQSTTIVVNQEEKEKTDIEYPVEIAFDDIVGQVKAKRKCKLIERYLEEPERFGKWAPRNILFHGPSGTGKTMVAKALANKTDVAFLPVKATQLIGEFVGEGSRQIHQLYERAGEIAPSIIFIDELDAIALDRRYQELRGDVAEIVNALLTEMDGISQRDGVCTICATNRTAVLDGAVRSRFEEEIEFVLPGKEERKKIIELNLQTFPIKAEANVGELAKLTNGLSGRDIVEKVLKSALHHAIMDDMEKVEAHYFEKAASGLQKKETNTHLYA